MAAVKGGTFVTDQSRGCAYLALVGRQLSANAYCIDSGIMVYCEIGHISCWQWQRKRRQGVCPIGA